MPLGIFRRFHKIAKATIFFVMSRCLSVRLHGASSLSVGGFS